MKPIFIVLFLLLTPGVIYAAVADCATARANAVTAAELIAKAEGAGLKLAANAKARIAACFKPQKRKHR